MSGSDVRTLQADLTKAGFKTPAVGMFGPMTARNVKSFERKYHMAVNGLVNSAFVRKLQLVLTDPSNADSTPGSGGTSLGQGGPAGGKKHAKQAASADDPTSVISNNPVLAPVTQDGGSQHLGERTLHQGMSGHDVRVLQGYLTLAGFPTEVDGAFGPGTKANVVKFEQANGLADDGVLTYAQSQSLRQVVAKAMTSDGPVSKATLNSDGTVTPPAGAPQAVVEAINAANSIIDKPYRVGGGHGKWNDSAYDCSGAVSFALHGANLLSAPEDSTQLESYGSAGQGQWMTIYADSAHTFIVIGGLAFDTAHWGPTTPSGTGPRWLTASNVLSNLQDGGHYIIRHPSGL
ncbi:MAG TPA: peptidoglycan-binding domain-containing protein [Solirubrobacteraceae bacterium]|jgi:peptidoglycan hydrolase-like protein with peptidoglycan-binding domain